MNHFGQGETGDFISKENETLLRKLAPVAKTPTIDDSALKVRINTLVWEVMPDTMTLGKADELSCKIFDLCREAEKLCKD